MRIYKVIFMHISAFFDLSKLMSLNYFSENNIFLRYFLLSHVITAFIYEAMLFLKIFMDKIDHLL